MSSFRAFIATLVFFAFLSILLLPAHATEYYALRLSGSDCVLCHSDPQQGSLNETGLRFQERGYRYPFSWKQVCYYIAIPGGLKATGTR
jgi:hypothetical protein